MISPGQSIEAEDFISASEKDATPSNDEGRVAKLNDLAQIDNIFTDVQRFGDGSDGAVNLDGTNTFAAFLSKSGNTYTMLRDMYATTLTVASGVTLKTDGYIFHASVEVTGAGTIDFGTPNAGAKGGSSGSTGASGGASSGSGRFKTTAGGQGGQGALSQNTDGSNAPATTGVTSAIGTSATSVSGGNSEARSGATGSAVTAPTIKLGANMSLTKMGLDLIVSTLTFVFYKVSGQAGGGGGGGSGNFGGATGKGGAGGGASGGVVFGIARLWSGTFTIKAIGGAGGESSVSDNSWSKQSGPGAGGNGGVSVMLYGRKTWTGSYNLAGGAAGAIDVSVTPTYASAAQSGATGTYYEIQI